MNVVGYDPSELTMLAPYYLTFAFGVTSGAAVLAAYFARVECSRSHLMLAATLVLVQILFGAALWVSAYKRR